MFVEIIVVRLYVRREVWIWMIDLMMFEDGATRGVWVSEEPTR